MIAFMLLFCFPCFTTLYAQSFTVTGTVSDAQGGIPGANVTVKGSTVGTVTDLDGKFSLNAPSSKSVLVVSYIGYTTQEVAINNQKTLNIKLIEDSKSLDEVVVVGYGVQKKSHLTGSVSKMDIGNITDIPVSRVDQALQGKIAGVNIQNTTSEVGTAPAIRIRGMGSISADSSPLIVIDGYPIPDGLSTLDAADIASIEVLKDAASAAIYGSRAAGGVILVTTKSGSIDKPRYNVKLSSGIKWAYALHPIMSSKEYANMLFYEDPLAGRTTSLNNQAYAYIDNNTDWQREGLEDNPQMQSIQFSVSGGKSGITYYISGNYSSEDGIMVDSHYNRLQMRARINAKLSKRIDVGVNIAPSYSKTQRPTSNFIDFYRTPSFMPVRHTTATAALTGKKEGEYAHGADFNSTVYTRPDGTTFTASPFQTANLNPRSILDNEKRAQKDYNIQGNGFINIEILKGLTFKSSNGFYIRYRQNNEYNNYGSRKDGDPAKATYNNRMYIDLLSENTFNYTKKINKHDFSALLGYTAQTTSEEYAGIVGMGFPTDKVQTINNATELDLTNTNTTKNKTAMMSFLSRVNYSYNEKYLLSVSIRTDGSSLFAEGKRWGWFPSASAGWRVSEESFMKGIDWISQLKLRGSIGVTGNNNIPANSYFNLMYPANYSLGTGGGSIASGLANTSYTRGNNNITWEQTNEYNAGLDFGVFNNRLTLGLEFYYSTTKKLLFAQPALSFTGFNNYWNNIGRVRNRGLELELSSTNIQHKDFEWNTSFNIATNNNKLLELSGEARLISKGEREEGYLAQVGKPAIQFYGYKTIGVWNTQEEINANPHLSTDVPGGLRVMDINDDKIIDDKDRTVIGNPFPDFTWGITNTFKYKRFDLYIMIQGVQGVDVFNGDGYYTESKRFNLNYVRSRWISPEYPGDGKTPYDTRGTSWQLTDYMIEDGSYIALRDVVLGYTFDKKKLKKVGLQSLRLYASGQNLLYLMAPGYRGINPEARATSGQYASPLVNGYQRGGFPLQSSVMAGIELNF